MLCVFAHAQALILVLLHICMKCSFFFCALSFPVEGVCWEQSCYPLVSRSTVWASGAAHPTRPRGQWPSEFPPAALPRCWLWQGSPLLLVHIMIYFLCTHTNTHTMMQFSQYEYKFTKCFIDIFAGSVKQARLKFLRNKSLLFSPVLCLKPNNFPSNSWKKKPTLLFTQGFNRSCW